MPAVEPDDPRLQSRPVWGLLLLALPILGVVVVVVGWTGMIGLGLAGRAADGPELALAFRGCEQARGSVAARLADMGYAATLEPSEGGFVARFQGPADPATREGLAATLARTGRWEVLGGGEVLATSEEVVDASVRLDLMMVGSTLIHLRPAGGDRVADYVRREPRGALEFRVDGAPVGTQQNGGVVLGEVEISPPMADEQARMREVAALAVVIDHPHPCPVEAQGPPAR